MSCFGVCAANHGSTTGEEDLTVRTVGGEIRLGSDFALGTFVLEGVTKGIEVVTKDEGEDVTKGVTKGIEEVATKDEAEDAIKGEPEFFKES